MAVDPIQSADDGEFWRIKTVVAKCGLSRSTLYRRMRETDPDSNPFPKSRPFRGQGAQSVFWLSDEVRQWQAREMAEHPAPPTRTLVEMIG